MKKGDFNVTKNFQHPLFRFLTVGVINTLLSITVIFCLKFFYSFSDVTANFIGYVAGLICSFILNKKWTFNHTGTLLQTVLKFILVFLVAYIANLMLVLLFIKFGVNAYLSHLIGIPIYTAIFYLGSKLYVFKLNA